MDYCEAQNFLKNKNHYKHVFKTLFHPIKIDSYLERHKILEIIGELMIRIAIDRPSNFIDYLSTKVFEIARQYRYKRNIVKIEFNNCTQDAFKMLKALSIQSHIPIIECSNKDERDALTRCSSLRNHHLIICDFINTSNRKHGDQKRMKIMPHNLASSNKCPAASSRAIDVSLCEENLKQVLRSVKENVIKKSNIVEWNMRILIVGRTGSGRRTQASLIADELGLIFIDFDYLRAEYDQQCLYASNDKLSFWGFAQETILKPNCLRNGYICASDVISREILEILMEKFIYQPNQIIFLHTNQNKCLRRISHQRQKGIYIPYQSALAYESFQDFLHHQMMLYELHKTDFVEYFQQQQKLGNWQMKIFHVNGNGKIEDIKNLILAHLKK